MTTVIINSVSAAAAKRAFDKIVNTNDVIMTGPKSANGNALDVYMRPKDCYYDKTGWCAPDAPYEVVVLSSYYFNEVSLLEYANKVAGRGTVKIPA